MPNDLIAALRSGKIAQVEAVVRTNPAVARQPAAMMEAGRLAFQTALALLVKHGGDINASARQYRALHALLQEDAHGAASAPSRERLACLDWMLAHGADPETTGGWPPARAIVTAAFVGRREYVERLRNAGAKIDGFAAA